MSGYEIIGCFISSVSYSGSFIPVVFLVGEMLYMNAYRAISSAFSDSGSSISATVVYRKRA